MNAEGLSQGLASLSMDTGADGGIVTEIQSRHGHSAQPESQQVLAVLQAVLEVIAAEGMAATPTTIFAAIMSALDRPDAQSSPVTCLAMCTLLGVTLTRVPNSVLRSKFNSSVQLLTTVVQRNKEQAAACKAALLCLGQVLAAVEPGAWLAASPGFQLLLAFITDPRPKVRRRAQASATDVLAALQASPASLTPASEAIVAVCKVVLPGPAAAARAAAAASNKQRAAAESAIAGAVSDVLHLLGALKAWAPLMAGASLPGLVDLLVKLYGLRQPLLSRHTSEVLAALAASPASHITPGQLQQLLALLIDGEAASLLAGAGSGLGGGAAAAGAAGGDQLSAMARLLETGLTRLAEVQPEGAARLLPKVVHLLVPLLAAEQDGVRYSSSAALQSLLKTCLTPQLVAAMQQQQQQQSKGGMPPLQSLVAAVASSLGARYQEAWGLALPVAGALCEVLASGGAAALAAPVVSALGHICAGLSDEAEQLEQQAMDMEGLSGPGSSSSSYAHAAEAAMGTAIRCLGPQQVLDVLPLQIQEGLSGTGEARTWLLPALRKHVCGAPLAYWQGQLLPLARQMGAAAAAASAAGRKSTAVACHALELQLWGSLQAFASWPTDAAAVYPSIAPELAAAFHTREDLRGIISSVLVRLCRQARNVATAAAQGGLAASAKTRSAIEQLGLVSGAAANIPGAGRGEADDDENDEQQQQGSDDEDEEEEYGQQQQQQRGSAGARQQRGLEGFSSRGGEVDEGPDAAAAAPGSYTADVALSQLLALRSLAPRWLPLLCKMFVDAPPEARGHVGEALAAYASVSDSHLLANLFRTAMQKYLKIGTDAAAAVPPPDPILDGGSSPEERQASFLELALCLAGGLPDSSLDPLFAACRQHILGGSSLLQKRSYRVLSYLTASRPDWLAAHLAAVLELLLLGSTAALSPAKRYRLRCLRPLILLLDTTPCPPLPGLVDAATGAEKLPGGAALAAAAAAGAADQSEERRSALAQLLVGELVLATKEVNKKTRTAAYQLLVDIAHELDESRPLNLNGAAAGLNPADGSDDDEMEYGDDAGRRRGGKGGRGSRAVASGGLLDFVNAVMGGLVGSSPHMQSAAVLALARLSFEFAGQLEGVVGRLLPAVLLLLLRSQSREVIKAVLGFIKVCAMRMPVDMLLTWLPQILEGMLIWADDSKNKFRLKIRVIMERLVRRCGLESVSSACPPGDAKLLAHIRKQNSRKERRKAAGSEGGSQVDAAEFDRRSQRSAGSAARSATARTARASEWGHTAIFSDEGVDDGQENDRRGGRAGSVAGGRSLGGRSRANTAAGGSRGVRLAGDGETADPQDLLEASTARQLVRSAAGGASGRGGAAGAAAAAAAADFPRGDDGRMVIKEGEPEDEFGWTKKRKGGKRKRSEDDFGFGSDDDSDMEDMRGIAGLKAAVASVANAKSVKFAPSIAMSLGNRSTASKKSAGTVGGKSGSGRASQHSGDRYKSKAGASGDVKGKSGVDPYAYWQFDRKMLNRRRGKQAAASKGLGGVVAGAQKGALKGAKAKRAQAVKRTRR